MCVCVCVCVCVYMPKVIGTHNYSHGPPSAHIVHQVRTHLRMAALSM